MYWTDSTRGTLGRLGKPACLTLEDSGAGWSSAMGRGDGGSELAVPASEPHWPLQTPMQPFTRPSLLTQGPSFSF